MAARSHVYDYFTKEVVLVKNSKTNIEENVTFCVCSLSNSTGEKCGKRYVCNEKSGTGNLLRHLRSVHSINVSKSSIASNDSVKISFGFDPLHCFTFVLIWQSRS